MAYVYDVRYVVKLMLEADTPLAVGSGNSDVLTDSPVCLDANDLPMIPGSALRGVLRHCFARRYPALENTIFGFQDAQTSTNSEGSRIVVSHAHIVDGQGVVEGLATSERLESSYLASLQKLPVREHCKIDHRGVSDRKSRGKFDNQVVPKGVRFVCRIELGGTEAEANCWQNLLAILADPSFRVGSGTRKGFGKLKIVGTKSEQRGFRLRNAGERSAYLQQSASLNRSIGGSPLSTGTQATDYASYTLTLQPENSWSFGSGLPDKDADMTPVYEKSVQWNNDLPEWSQRMILVPATAVKGALAHRVAFHYNRLTGAFADKAGQDFSKITGEANPAVKQLFGCANDTRTDKGQIGQVIMSDLFVLEQPTNSTKILNHVAIDRFTGGARDTALFSERVVAQPTLLKLEFLVARQVLTTPDSTIKKAWEAALQDICDGLLPLGGGVMRGHGIFNGTMNKEGVPA